MGAATDSAATVSAATVSDDTTIKVRDMLQYTATHYSTLEYTAAHKF